MLYLLPQPGACLEWLDAADAALIAADVGLNTNDRVGGRLVALLREIERWGREPDAARRPRGRPGLSAGAPELAGRIALMRDSAQAGCWPASREARS